MSPKHATMPCTYFALSEQVYIARCYANSANNSPPNLTTCHDVSACCIPCTYFLLICGVVAKQPSLHYTGHGRPSRLSLFKITSSTPNPIVEAAVRRFMTPDARPIFQRHWEQAKERLGPWKAGSTLRSFVEKNTQVRDGLQSVMRVPSNRMAGD